MRLFALSALLLLGACTQHVQRENPVIAWAIIITLIVGIGGWLMWQRFRRDR